MIYQIILFAIVSCLAGIKRPLHGGLAGMVSAPLLSMIGHPFDLSTILVLMPLGFGFGLLCGRVSWWIFRSSDDNQQQTKPYAMPFNKNQRGGIIYTDDEAKNAEENKRS